MDPGWSVPERIDADRECFELAPVIAERAHCLTDLGRDDRTGLLALRIEKGDGERLVAELSGADHSPVVGAQLEVGEGQTLWRLTPAEIGLATVSGQ